MRTGSETVGRRGMFGRVGTALVGGLLLCVTGAGLGGCNNGMKEQNASLMQENQDLRDKNAQLEASLQGAESQRAAADGEMRTKGEPVGRAARAPSGGDNGFGGEGVTVSNRAGEIVVGVAGDVLFDSGKATLKTSAKKTLDGIATNIKSKYGARQIRVEGYTDTDPIKKSTFKTNERLSAERAMAVEQYLVSKGVSNAKIYSAAFGPSAPKSSKKDSRRVEIVILDSGS